MDAKSAAASVAARFGGSAIAKQAVQAARQNLHKPGKAGSSHAHMFAFKGPTPDGNPTTRHDPLTDTRLTDAHYASSPRQRSADGVANDEAIHALTDPNMQPFLAPTYEEALSDNKGYRPPPKNAYEEELFQGRRSASPPSPHSRSVPIAAIHASDARFSQRSPRGPIRQPNAGSFGAAAASSNAGSAPQSPRRRALGLSYEQRRSQLEDVLTRGVTHGALPASRPHSPEALIRASLEHAAAARYPSQGYSPASGLPSPALESQTVSLSGGMSPGYDDAHLHESRSYTGAQHPKLLISRAASSAGGSGDASPNRHGAECLGSQPRTPGQSTFAFRSQSAGHTEAVHQSSGTSPRSGPQAGVQTMVGGAMSTSRSSPATRQLTLSLPGAHDQAHSPSGSSTPVMASSPVAPGHDTVDRRGSLDQAGRSGSLSPHGRAIKTVTKLRSARPASAPHHGREKIATHPTPDYSRVRPKYLEDSHSAQPSDSRRRSHQKYHLWKLGKLYDDVPDYKYSQPSTRETASALGTGRKREVVTLKQIYWSFDEAHPALADKHCLRSAEQSRALDNERHRAQLKIDAARRSAAAIEKRIELESFKAKEASDEAKRAARRASRPRAASAGPGSHAADARPSSSRRRTTGPTGRDRAYQAANAGAALAERSRAVALDAAAAITRSERLTRRDEADALSPPPPGVPRRGASAGATVSHPHDLQHAGANYGYHAQAAPQSPNMDDMIAALNHGARAGYTGDLRSVTGPGDPEPFDQPHARPGSAPPGGQQPAERAMHPDGHGVPGAVDARMDEDEADVAYGKYNAERFKDYDQEMSGEMRVRMEAGIEAGDMEAGYGSDLEREELTRRQVAAEQALHDLSSDAAGQSGTAGFDAATQSFMEQNTWMDAYRRDAVARSYTEGIPSDQYFQDVVSADFSNPAPMLVSIEGGLSPEEQQLIQSRLLPTDVGYNANMCIANAERLTGRSFDGTHQASGYHSDGGNLNRQHVKFVPTKPKTFGFERRARARPKPISQVKLEQDLEIMRREEEKIYMTRFKANKVPKMCQKVSNGYFFAKIENQMAEAQSRVESRRQELKAMAEDPRNGPFSFVEKDMAKLKDKAEALKRHRNDKNRFQVPFKAKPVPSSVYEARFMEEVHERPERRKQQAKQQAQEKLDRINAEFKRTQGRVAGAMEAAMKPFIGTFEDNITYQRSEHPSKVHPFAIAAAKAVGLHDTIMQLPNRYKTIIKDRTDAGEYHTINNAEMHLLALARKNFKVRVKLAKQRHEDTLWNVPGKAHKKAGVVPDFDALHAEWESQLTEAKKQLRAKSLSVPVKEFNFQKGTPEQQAARAAKAEEKRRRIIQDKFLDEEELPEVRWPFKSARGKTHPTPPPAFPPVAFADTKANRMRQRHIQRAKEAGQFDLKPDKERRAAEAKKEELARRAAAHVAREQRAARRKIAAGMRAAAKSGMGMVEEATSPRIKAVGAGGAASPLAEVYRQSRHQQIAKDVSQTVRDILAGQGMDVLRYVDGTVNPRQIITDIRDSVPNSRLQVRHRLEGYPDNVVKALLREAGQEWDPAAPDSRADGLDRVAQHIWNFQL